MPDEEERIQARLRYVLVALCDRLVTIASTNSVIRTPIIFGSVGCL